MCTRPCFNHLLLQAKAVGDAHVEAVPRCTCCHTKKVCCCSLSERVVTRGCRVTYNVVWPCRGIPFIHCHAARSSVDVTEYRTVWLHGLLGQCGNTDYYCSPFPRCRHHLMLAPDIGAARLLPRFYSMPHSGTGCYHRKEDSAHSYCPGSCELFIWCYCRTTEATLP